MTGRLSGCGQFDGVAELLQRADQVADLVLLVVAGGVVVLTQVGEYLAVASIPCTACVWPWMCTTSAPVAPGQPP